MENKLLSAESQSGPTAAHVWTRAAHWRTTAWI